jgi:hypothetical protein
LIKVGRVALAILIVGVVVAGSDVGGGLDAVVAVPAAHADFQQWKLDYFTMGPNWKTALYVLSPLV